MKRLLLSITAFLVLAFTGVAIADYTIKDGANASQTILAFVCSSTKICPAHVQINSSGTEIGTTSNPVYVDCNSSGNTLCGLVNSAIPAGTNLIGDVNLRQGGTALSATNGAYANLLQGNAVISATNGLYGNQLQGNAVLSVTNPTFTQEVPGTSGGISAYFVQPTAGDNHANIKNGAGQVYHISVTNNSATVNYLRLYNAATGFNGCNSATNIVGQWAIPASTSVGGITMPFPLGIAFSTGISICVSSGYATTDTTNATASAMSVNIGYK